MVLLDPLLFTSPPLHTTDTGMESSANFSYFCLELSVTIEIMLGTVNYTCTDSHFVTTI